MRWPGSRAVGGRDRMEMRDKDDPSIILEKKRERRKRGRRRKRRRKLFKCTFKAERVRHGSASL